MLGVVMKVLHGLLLSLALLLPARPAAPAEAAGAAGAGLPREAAVKMIQAFLRSHGVKSVGLNDNNLGGLELGGQVLYFEYLPGRRALRANALVYRFRKPPRRGVLDGFQQEQKAGTDSAGGTVEYQADNRGLFLSRVYAAPAPEQGFAAEMDRLAQAAERWREQVLPRVAARVFPPAEAK